jgi:hypothetical protein
LSSREKKRTGTGAADYVGFPVREHQRRLAILAANRPVSRGVYALHAREDRYRFSD